EVRLVLPPDAWIDLEAASVGVHRAESAVALGEWTRAWAPARTALYVANRGFPPGEDAPWIEERRHRLEDVRLRALECVAPRASPWAAPSWRRPSVRPVRSSSSRRSGKAATAS
ncbi:MAG: hypothetical protein ACRDNE_11165, partial [Gaiellaceae bacterium]